MSALEKEIIYWLAINREPTTLEELQTDMVDKVPEEELVAALASLQRRSVIERDNPTLFTLQPMIMEYATDHLIEGICQEISTLEFALFNRHALIKAQAKTYVRIHQERIIFKLVAEKLLTTLGKKQIEDNIKNILATLQAKPLCVPGYAGGNALNLFCHLQSDLSGCDFSKLTIWQANLQDMILHDVNFSEADLARSIFPENFDEVLSVAFSPNGNLLVIGCADAVIRLWEVNNGKYLLSFHEHTNWVWTVTFSPNGEILASGSQDQTIRLWNVQTGQCLNTLEGHTDCARSVAFSPE